VIIDWNRIADVLDMLMIDVAIVLMAVVDVPMIFHLIVVVVVVVVDVVVAAAVRNGILRRRISTTIHAAVIPEETLPRRFVLIDSRTNSQSRLLIFCIFRDGEVI